MALLFCDAVSDVASMVACVAPVLVAPLPLLLPAGVFGVLVALGIVNNVVDAGPYGLRAVLEGFPSWRLLRRCEGRASTPSRADFELGDGVPRPRCPAWSAILDPEGRSGRESRSVLGSLFAGCLLLQRLRAAAPSWPARLARTRRRVAAEVEPLASAAVA